MCTVRECLGLGLLGLGLLGLGVRVQQGINRPLSEVFRVTHITKITTKSRRGVVKKVKSL